MGKIEDLEKFMKDLDAKYEKKWQKEGRFLQTEPVPTSKIKENNDKESGD